MAKSWPGPSSKYTVLHVITLLKMLKTLEKMKKKFDATTVLAVFTALHEKRGCYYIKIFYSVERKCRLGL